MAVNITNDQFLTSTQTIQNRFVRLELLNYEFQTIDEIEGVCINGSLSIDANSDIRRTASLTLSVRDTSFDVASGGRIWLDRYVRVYVGVSSLRTGEVVWTNLGVFIVDEPTYSYDLSTNTLNLSLLDLMAKLTGARNGYLEGIPTVLKAGENIRKAIIDTLALGGFTKYVVEEAPFPGVIPIDLEFNQGATIYELLSGLRDIYPNYEMFFDVNGVFFYKPIPTGENEPIMADDSLFDYVVTKEDLVVDFQNVKNSIEVYGRTHEPQGFSTDTKVENNVITLTIAGQEQYVEDLIYGFTLTDSKELKDVEIKVNELEKYPVKDDSGKPVTIPEEKGEIYYCVQYQNKSWRWLGHLQAYGLAEDTNPDSPFYIKGTVGKIRLPLFDGEYANCVTDDLAQERAEYELWLHTNMNNTLTLQGIPVYWLDVNMLIEYTQKRNRKTDNWIIKNLSMGFAPADTMSITGIKYYGKDYTSPDFDAIEYIEATGTQYIDTGFNPNQDTRVVVEFQVTDGFTGKGILAGTNDGTSYYNLGFDTASKGWYTTRYANNSVQAFDEKLNSHKKLSIDKNQNKTMLEEETITSNVPQDGFTIEKPLYIFADNNNGTAANQIKAKVYSIRIYDLGVLVRNFIPAREKATGEIGLYDAVELKFYKNKGTGNFVGGAILST